MNRRIFIYMSLLILLTVSFFAALWGVLFSKGLVTQMRDELRAIRLSIIDRTGKVIFDNVTDPELLENHLNRPEVIDAIQNGYGKSERYSGSLGKATYYYAVRTKDGNVLRLAFTTDNVTVVFYRFVIIVLVCLILAAGFAFIIARMLTKRIVTPINNIDLDAPEIGNYDELLPLLKKIDTQKREISAQFAEIENRTATITAITKNMKEGLLLLDESGKVLLANESVLEILDKNEAIGKNMVEICRDVNFIGRVKDCIAGAKTEMVMHLKEKFYSVFFNPVLEVTTVRGAVVLFIDITARYAAEAQRKEFSANVSHELKTPLTSVAALSEMIADGTAKEKDIRQFAEKINNQSKRLIDIIDDIIKLSEFDEREIPRAFTYFNLYDIANTVINSLSEKASKRNVSVELNGDPNLFVTANMRMIDELLYNLTDNAIKYNREGGRVDVRLSDDREYVRISVEDSGIGISREHIGRIFERFYRVDKSRSKKTGGTGLGLSIVKHIAEFHGGHVEVESEEGAGTKFICTFRKAALSLSMPAETARG